MIMDYFFGIAAAIKTGQKFSREVAFWGLIKKLVYLGLLVLCFLVDYMILNYLSDLGIKIPTKVAFGLVGIVYVYGTEGLSLIEHFIDLGLSVPPKLGQFLEVLRDQGEVVMVPSKDGDTNA